MVKHRGEKPFVCNQCDYKCTQAGQLKLHMLTHNGQKPFTCNQCTYACTAAKDLKRHMLIHSGEKPFSCNECDYKCGTACDLKRHRLTHTGEKPFACKDNDDNYIHDDNVMLWSYCRRHLPQGLAWVLQQRRHTWQSLRLDSDDCNDKTTNIVCEDYICRKSSDNINKSRWCLLYLLLILSLQARTPIRAPVQLLAGITTPRNLAEVRSNWWWWPGWDDAKDLLIMQAPCRHQGHPGQPSTLRSTLPMPRQDSDDDDDKTTNIVGEDYICINLFDVMTMIKTQILLMFSIFDDCRLQPLRECSSWPARAQTRGTWTSSSPSLFKLRQNSRGPFRACPRNIYKKTWPHIYKKWSLQFLSNNICRLSCNWHFSLKTWPHIYKKWSLQFVSSNICRFSCNWHFL